MIGPRLVRHAVLPAILVAGWSAPAGGAPAGPPEIAAVRALSGTPAAAATLIVEGIEGGSLPLAAIALVERQTALEGSPRVRLPVEVELPAALEIASGADLELYVYALDTRGSVAAHRGLAVTLPEASGAGVRVATQLKLPPGGYSLRVLILEPASHRFGLVQRSVQVGPATTLGEPRFEDRCSAWAVAATAGSTPAGRAARPVLLQGRTTRLSAAAPAPGLDEDVRVRARLTPSSAEGSRPRAFDARLTGVTPSDGRLEVALDLPPIGRGVWELRLEASAGTAAELVSPPVEVWVVDSEDLDGPESDPCARTWSAVLARASRDADVPPIAATPEPTLPDPSDDSRRVERRRAAAAYEEVLALLASTGDVERAARALCRLEESFATELARLPVLQHAELDVARRLGQREPEVLAPVLLLHHHAYLEHRMRTTFALAAHSARVARAIGELFVDRAERVENGTVASRILTSLAEYGHRHRSFVPGQRLLEVALEFEPDNPEALKLLAVNYEWFGRYEEAQALLERLVALTVTDREARLRLGILVWRAGQPAAAERHFRRIVAEGAEPWVLSVAFQQLGTLLLDAGRLEEALEVLERGRARLPDDQRLHILGAWALERAGRFAAARRLFEELPIDGAPGSPRVRYGDSMTAPLVALRAEIGRAAAARMPLLGRALEGGGRRRGAR